ncbi:MAG: 50S ribosomal protein L22 [Candidatus Pacebacteria bacterium]|nr:50S ribosomal protein L22 [Candidatus Paceibacterota bacterium]
MQVIANVKNFRSTPRKTREIADYIRGKELMSALIELKFINKKTAKGFIDLLNTAKANAENNLSIDSKGLYISSLRVEDGKVLKRHRAGSRSRTIPFKRRLSNIYLILEYKEKSVEKKEVKKEIKTNKEIKEIKN